MKQGSASTSKHKAKRGGAAHADGEGVEGAGGQEGEGEGSAGMHTYTELKHVILLSVSEVMYVCAHVCVYIAHSTYLYSFSKNCTYTE